MLAFITNLTFSEIAIIVVGAIMVFGKDLPRVVMRGMQQLAKLRRAVKEMWSEAGLDQEMRRVRAELDAEVPNFSSPKTLIAQGKSKVIEPVQAWRKNLEKEVVDVVPVEKKRPASVDAAPSDSDAPTAAQAMAGEAQPGHQDPKPAAPKSGDSTTSKPPVDVPEEPKGSSPSESEPS